LLNRDAFRPQPRSASRRGNYTNQLLETTYLLDTFVTTENLNNNNNNNADTITQLLQSFMQPVDVYPTPAQIESATRTATYGDIVRPINNQCPISMEAFEDNDTVTVIRHCGHVFHTESLSNWFQTNTRCPVCRFDVRDYNAATSSAIYAPSPHSQASLDAMVDASGNRLLAPLVSVLLGGRTARR